MGIDDLYKLRTCRICLIDIFEGINQDETLRERLTADSKRLITAL
jgi:hypothetical protein